MRIAVLGAGAIGGWLAGTLAQIGAQVSLVARGATLQAIRQRGLRLVYQGDESSLRIPAGPATELGPQDIVIIATKAHDVPRALAELLPLLGPETAVVSALNGLPWWFCQQFEGPLNNVVLESVDPGGRTAAAIHASRVVGCVVHASIARPEPGLIHIGKVDRLTFGEPSGFSSERVQWLVEHFSRSGITATASAQIRLEIWLKLWGNMTLNPLSALTRSTTGQMLGDSAIHQLCLRMMEEMAACGAKLDLAMPMSGEQRMDITRKLGDFRTSMLQDLEHRLPLEYSPQLGAVVEVAVKLGVPAPFCSAVLGLVRQLSVRNTRA